MKTTYTIARLLAVLVGLTGLLNMGSVHVYSLSGSGYEPPTSHQDLARVKESYSKIPLSFVANYGQADNDVKFISRGSGYSLALAPTTFTLAVADTRKKNNEESRTSASVIQATLLGGKAAAKLTGLERLITKTNYFIGSDPRRWKTNLPNYAKVKYSRVYPGVDLVFYGNQNLLEYDFIVSPGADPNVIALGFEGITDTRIDEKGDLVLRTDAGEMRQSRPVVYQQVDGARRMIPASYLIKGKKQVAFQIANYDRSKPLIIDPTLAFSTFLGGSGSDRGDGIAVDSAGNAYITGITASTNFPVTAGAFQTMRAGFDQDAFVTKMNSTGTALIYSTYFGGANRDAGNDIAVDGAGNAYITGQSESSDLPTTPGAFRTTPVFTDETIAFAMKLNATGTALVYSTYLGSAGGSGITIDTAGDAYITGQAATGYPTTPGAFQTVSGGSSDAFVTKLNSTGSALVYSTFLGGTGFDSASEIAIDALGNAYVTGQAGAGFPVTAGAFQTVFNGGGGDAFVTKLNSTGTALVYSTFLGGSGSDGGLGIAVNSAGNAYVTGSTDSLNFPVTAGAFQSVKDVGLDAFVTELSVAGNALAYSTYLGGDGLDFGTNIAVDTAGNASVTGLTGSTDFPTADAIQSAYGGNNDAFVTRLNPTGTGLVFSSYLGGSNGDAGFAISVDAAGSIYLTGSTSSTDFPTTPGVFQTVFGGSSDAFVTKLVFSNFDVCLQDDGNGNSFQFNSTTGEYKFTQAGVGGVTLTGTGTLSQQGCLLLLEDNQPGRKVKAHFNHCNNMGQAVIQIESGTTTTFVVTDKDTSNSDCP